MFSRMYYIVGLPDCFEGSEMPYNIQVYTLQFIIPALCLRQNILSSRPHGNVQFKCLSSLSIAFHSLVFLDCKKLS